MWMFVVGTFVLWELFFFFSSRRRHTRWTGDWSSDVCSSDLVQARISGPGHSAPATSTAKNVDHVVHSIFGLEADHQRRVRSEERRVGKECRSRWAPDH